MLWFLLLTSTYSYFIHVKLNCLHFYNYFILINSCRIDWSVKVPQIKFLQVVFCLFLTWKSFFSLRFISFLEDKYHVNPLVNIKTTLKPETRTKRAHTHVILGVPEHRHEAALPWTSVGAHRSITLLKVRKVSAQSQIGVPTCAKGSASFTGINSSCRTTLPLCACLTLWVAVMWAFLQSDQTIRDVLLACPAITSSTCPYMELCIAEVREKGVCLPVCVTV